MDRNAPKTPATLPFAAWQALSPAAAAREVHTRVAALPDSLRHAALAWLKSEEELAAALKKGGPVSAPALSGRERVAGAETAPPPLRGIPYLLKDLFDLRGVPTRAGSKFLEHVRPVPDHDSVVVQRLAQLGAACAGKTHLVEFASGLTGENPHYGDCPHPLFPNRLSGGSSSGSAALVAAGVTPLSIGTDTGGSVRVPAAWCGLYGFRLTPGDELIRDAFPLAPSLDTAGWFTANAADMRATIEALKSRSDRQIAGAAGLTPAATFQPRGCYLNARHLVPGMDPAVATACDYAAASLSAHADPVAEAALLLSWHQAVESYLAIATSEAHAIHRDWLAPYHEHYDPIVWRRFSDAGHLPAAEIARAREDVAAVRTVFRDFFRAYDYLVLPAVPCVAPTKAGATAELRRNILTLTAPASLAGLPVLSLPVTLPSGLTAGLQVIAPAANSAAIPWLLNQ